MSSIEAVEYMKRGKRITHGNNPTFWYQLYHNGSIYSFFQDTPCAARVLGLWDTTDEFIEGWSKTGCSSLMLYDNVG